MTTKAELEKRVAELEEQNGRGVQPKTLRLFSFIYNERGAIMTSAPPPSAAESLALKNALKQISSIVDERLLREVAQEAQRNASTETG